MHPLKYIMFDDFTWLIFPNMLAHIDVAKSQIGKIPVSAGFVKLQRTSKIKTFGQSDSLELQSSKKDGDIISKFFFQG